MADIFNSYISKLYVSLNKANDDVIVVSSSYFSPEGDVFVLDKRTISPSVIPTVQSIQDLSPEVSSVYPYKIVPPLDFDSSSIILSPTIDTPVTASQNYYTPVYFERYERDIIAIINKSFTELEPPPEPETPIEESIEELPGE